MRDTVRGTCRVETTMKWTISASALILPLQLAWASHTHSSLTATCLGACQDPLAHVSTLTSKSAIHPRLC